MPSGLPCPIRGLALLLITRTSPVGEGMEKSQGQGRGPSRYRQDTAEPTSTIEKISDPEEEFIEIDPAEVDPAELAQEVAMDHGYFDGPIPADITAPPGLSARRAELARFMEWRRRTVAELEHLEEAHHRAVEALGGESVTKKKIDALIEADIRPAAIRVNSLGGSSGISRVT